jgi:glycosyltransferase involved in cell wall biosynthesis
MARRVGALAAKEVTRAPADTVGYVRRSGLFDLQWFCEAYGADPKTALRDWCLSGWSDGQKPSLYFDPAWYLEQNKDVAADGANPLLHYIRSGETEGRRPSPLFDPIWYRQTYAPPEDELCLAHYLRHRTTGKFSPSPDFDVNFYVTAYPDIAAAGVDAFAHFMEFGFREDRCPSPDFDTAYYRSRYLPWTPDVNPLLDLQTRRQTDAMVLTKRPKVETTIPAEVRRFTRPSEDFEVFAPLRPGAELRAWLLAYYLPQFHAIPENDAWWGKGFTEWNNVARALPRFAGHYQPRIPRDLGHYSLDDPETMRQQIEMAKAGGLHGFVFYYYWFNGTRLLEKPLEQFLADLSLDMPFCLMWANENWTRRWDGADADILITQDYRPAEDEDLVRSFGRHFADPRYIRIDNRPLLMIYRPSLIPDARTTLARWRALFQTLCGENPIMMMGQGFDAADPAEFGLDGAIEFPPHKIVTNLASINDNLVWLDDGAKTHVLHYNDTVRASLTEPRPTYPLIKTAIPGWDNDARREGQGMVIHGSTPAAFGEWVSALIDRARQVPFFGQPIVCINAWNEWAESAYLEPDVHYGAAYLNAMARAVCAEVSATDDKILLIGHDAHRHGAQTLLLALGEQMQRAHGLKVEFILLEGGPMASDYAAVAPTTVLSRVEDLQRQAGRLKQAGFRAAIVNTVAAGSAAPVLKAMGLSVTLLVHELPSLIREKNLTQSARRGTAAADHVVFPAAFVRDGVLDLIRHEDGDSGLPTILPQGIYQAVPFDAAARLRLRAELGVPERARLLIGIGYADMRKGFDLFLQLWRTLQGRKHAFHLVWAGNVSGELHSYLAPDIAAAEANGTFRMLGFRKDVNALLSAADLFVLTSREDPLPSTVLEAMSAGLPSVAFDQSGGIPDLLDAHDAGRSVPRGDIIAMAEAAEALCAVTPAVAARRRARLSAIAEARFRFDDYTRAVVDLADRRLLTISVAVPNYNYARHLPARLQAIFGQWAPVREILFLDDASTDDSLAVARDVAKDAGRDIRIIANDRNSGSVFRQWRRAAEAATGEYLWIAEADDDSDPRFLTRLRAAMETQPEAVMAFADSVAIDPDNAVLSTSYKSYYNETAPGLLTADGDFAGDEFLHRCLSERNLILNVSAVLWRRHALLAALDRCEAALGRLRVAGDWWLYADILSQPGARIAYVAEPLNRHRRHSESVTHSLDADRHIAEIAAVQGMVAQTVNADPKLLRRQARYRTEVSRQLGTT